MNGTSYQSPRFARNENVQLVASFNRKTDVRTIAQRVNPVDPRMDRMMRQNSARFI
jgi:hypothetical protein